jgi:hypothetical protein
MASSPDVASPGAASPALQVSEPSGAGSVTARSFILGLILAAVLSGVNAWFETAANVHFFGGVQMPFGAIFGLLFLVVVINGPLRMLQRNVSAVTRVLPPFGPAELLTMYSMMLFAALISTPGTESFFLTTGPTLFYFTTPQNKWADTFYSLLPRHFAPGWDGKNPPTNIIQQFYSGGVTIDQVPWHAWSSMLIAWSVLLLLVYSALFFTSLLFRRQWIENEALAFPLVQLPLQMVDNSGGTTERGGFWTNRTMWGGMALAFVVHMLKGMNKYYPDWPLVTSFQSGNAYQMIFTENPWNAIGTVNISFYFGAIGIAYLLTRELAFSFWFFFLLFKLQLVFVTMAGYPADSLPKDIHLARPAFLTWQSVGGWMTMAAILLWTARGHLQNMFREAINPRYIDSKSSSSNRSEEPFSARFVLVGLFLSMLGIMGWCAFSGINLLAAFVFFGIYAMASLVLARLVVEGGFLFPQVTFSGMEVLTRAFMGGAIIGKESIFRLSFMQPMFFSDMRTNMLPGFLHTLKIAHDLRLPRKDARKLLLAVVCAIIVSGAVMIVTNITTIYSAGGLTGYTWFTQNGGQTAFRGAATMIKDPPTVDPQNWFWISLGGGLVWLMTFARARYLWFPFHPLGFIVSSSFPITNLWPSFFLGWLVKSLLLRFGGQESAARARPFMIGLILGNAVAMVLWLIVGYFLGSYMTYWPA